jgi:hypothetical protein
MGTFHQAKNFVEEKEELSSEDEDHNMKKSLKHVSKKHGILDIIADDPKERTSSSELNVNHDVYLFLRKIDLEFL